jgi:peptidoglycan glycosyltransferase
MQMLIISHRSHGGSGRHPRWTRYIGRRGRRRRGDRAAGAPVNRPIRRVGYAVTVLILLLVGQLTYLQVVDANNLANDPKNVRKQLKEYSRARGEILTADGQIVAQSLPTTGDFKFALLPAGRPVHAHRRIPVVRQPRGHDGRRGVVRQGAHGRDTDLQLGDLGGLSSTGSRRRTTWCCRHESATDRGQALGGQRGVGGRARRDDGAVLAMYSNPSFNQRPVGPDPQVVQNNFNQINSGDQPRCNAYRDRYSPGSTFKVVTSKSAMEAGIATPDDPVFPEQDGFQIPGTDTILRNFGGDGTRAGARSPRV